MRKRCLQVNQQLNMDIPDHQTVVQLSQTIKNSVTVPDWMHSAQLCYEHHWISVQAFGQTHIEYAPTKCSFFGSYTPEYYDTSRSVGGSYGWGDTSERFIRWGLDIPDIPPSEDWWMNQVQLCFQLNVPSGADPMQCNRGISLASDYKLRKSYPNDYTQCTPVNQIHTVKFYKDSTDDRPGGCEMAWSLRAPQDAPIWFRNLHFCMEFGLYNNPHFSECGANLNNIHRLCAPVNQYTNKYLDNTGVEWIHTYDNARGCSMKWVLKEPTGNTV